MATLHFNMNIHPSFTPGKNGNPNQTIDQAFAKFGILNNLGKFLIEEGVRLLPINLRVSLREIKGHELREIPRNRVLPRGIKVIVFKKFLFH